MYNNIISIISGILNIYGTIKTVMTVIDIDFKELPIEGTVKKLSHPETDIFENRRNALYGISIIIIGFLLGIIEEYYEFSIISVIVTCIIIFVLLYLLKLFYQMQYIFLIQEYDKYLIRNGKPSLIDDLNNGEEIRNVKVPIKFNVNKFIKRLE